MEGQSQALIDRPLTRSEEFIFAKNRDVLKPELVPGSSPGTMLENDTDVDCKAKSYKAQLVPLPYQERFS